MIRYAIQRLLASIPLLLGVTLLSFALIHLVPGDPVRLMLGPQATSEAIAGLNHQLGLDRPLWEQYVHFLSNAVRLDFGNSIVQHTPVSSLLIRQSVPTILLLVYSVLISIVVALPLAIFASLRHNRLGDHVVRLITGIAVAMPVFWVGLVLAYFVSYKLELLPVTGYVDSPLGALKSLTLPAFTIAIYLSPVLVRSLRSAMLETMGTSFIDSVRARGLSESRVVFNHVVRNSLVSTITILGVLVSYLVSGTVVVENVFGIPGMGSLLVSAIEGRDFPTIIGVTVVLGTFVVIANLTTDLIHAATDPRVRLP